MYMPFRIQSDSLPIPNRFTGCSASASLLSSTEYCALGNAIDERPRRSMPMRPWWTTLPRPSPISIAQAIFGSSGISAPPQSIVTAQTGGGPISASGSPGAPSPSVPPSRAASLEPPQAVAIAIAPNARTARARTDPVSHDPDDRP